MKSVADILKLTQLCNELVSFANLKDGELRAIDVSYESNEPPVIRVEHKCFNRLLGKFEIDRSRLLVSRCQSNLITASFNYRGVQWRTFAWKKTTSDAEAREFFTCHTSRRPSAAPIAST